MTDCGPQPTTDRAITYKIRVDGAAVVLRMEIEIPMTPATACELGTTLIRAAEDADRLSINPDGESLGIWQGDR